MIDLLQLLRGKVEGAKIKKVSGSKGGEWHSPCPLCGGTDRFSVFPEQPGGELCQKHGLRGTWACVRGCNKGGDVISWFMEIEGLSFREALLELNIPLENQDQSKRSYRPLKQPYPKTSCADFIPRSYSPPAQKWQQAATKLALDAHRKILNYPSIMKYLANRGLAEDAVSQYTLGYIEGEGNHPEAIYRARSAYGLPEKKNRDGKLVHVFRIPRGITIPVWSKDNQVLRIRIRRRDIDRDKNNPKDPKYLLIPQPESPYSAPLVLFPEDIPPELATWVITEAELDAMAIHYACGGKVGAISILTAKGKPDQATHMALTRCARILVALDVDEDKSDGSNPGAEAWLWWKKTYPQAKLWPVPEGKDPGEAFALGVDLAQWIFAGTPLQKKPDLTGLELWASKTRNSGSLGASQENIVAEERKAEIEGFKIPASITKFSDLELPEMVTHHDLISSQMKCPLDDPDCLVPCPKTNPPFWWKYYRDCKRSDCKGHYLCILGVLRSQLFLEALNAEKNLSR